MNPNLEMQLVEKFPWLSPNQDLDNYSPYDGFGIETGDGWYQLIHDMFNEIAEAYKQGGLEVDIVLMQMKEKYGQLRTYFEYPDYRMYDIVEAIVNKYELLSEDVCELCGKLGKSRNRRGQRQVLCDGCSAKNDKGFGQESEEV